MKIRKSPLLYSERDLNPHNRDGHKILSLACLPFHHPSIHLKNERAKDGTRTRDPNLGKVMLYQLSYFRLSLSLSGCKDNYFFSTAKFQLQKS